MDLGTGIGIIRSPRAVYFGEGTRALVGKSATELGSQALLCVDEWLVDSPTLKEIQADLVGLGVTITTLVSKPEFSTADLKLWSAEVRQNPCDVIVAVGGGSTLDLAKLLSISLTHDEPIDRFFGEFQLSAATIPVVAVPTTAGTGSEVTPVAVVTDSRSGMKAGVSDPHLIPMVAICDPSLTISSPPSVTAHSGMDALSHAIESFTARRREPSLDLLTKSVFVGQNFLTDGFALEAVRLLATNLVAAVQDGTRTNVRSSTMLGSLLAGLSFAQAGTGAAHAIQYALNRFVSVPHGLAVGLLLPYVMRINFPVAVERFAMVASAVGLDDGSISCELAARETAVWARQIGIAVGLPESLQELGVSRAQIGRITEDALSVRRLIDNNARALGPPEMEAVLEAAYLGDLERLDAFG